MSRTEAKDRVASADDQARRQEDSTTSRFKTNCGDFTVRLDPEQSPNAAASFAALVESGFFDNTIFHRIPRFRDPGRRPDRIGPGRPGLLDGRHAAGGAQYTHGVVAMAKTGAEPAGTAGSQFFIVTPTTRA